MGASHAPALAGVHHLKLPVRDLVRSREWYVDRLGYEVGVEFVEAGQLMGVGLRHPNGGPDLALRLDPARAEAAAGFDYFAIGVPDKAVLEELAERLTTLGDPHAGVQFATIGWVLPMLHDPDGHEVRFSPSSITRLDSEATTTVHDPVEAAQQRDGRGPVTATVRSDSAVLAVAYPQTGRPNAGSLTSTRTADPPGEREPAD